MKDTAVICYQKANPPTKIHLQLFKKVIATAQQKEGDPLIFLSQEYDAQQNPMPWKLKVEYIKNFFNNKIYVCDKEDIKSLTDILSFVYQRNYKHVYILAGNDIIEKLQLVIDQQEEMQKEKKYFEFDTLEVVSIGSKDPDNEVDNATYSSAQARNAVLDNNTEKFENIVMAKNDEEFKNLYSIMKTGMGLTEHIKRKRIKI